MFLFAVSRNIQSSVLNHEAYVGGVPIAFVERIRDEMRHPRR